MYIVGDPYTLYGRPLHDRDHPQLMRQARTPLVNRADGLICDVDAN